VVAIVDDAKLRQEVNRMEALLLQAQEAYENQQTLFENNIGSETQLNNAKYAYDQQRAALESMKVDLANTQIKAPFSGKIEKTLAEVGELLNPGMPVVRLVDVNDLRIEVGVPSRYAGTLKVGDAVEFWINRDENRRFQGSISFVGSAVDPSSRTFDVEVSFPNKDEVMKVDMVAEVEFVTETRPSSIVVSEEYLFSSGENMVAYVVDEDENGNTISREVIVKTGSIHESNVVIESGLQAGDRFIQQGSSYLNDGTRIVITSEN
jgi:RND family efflux transporter MFP subunit